MLPVSACADTDDGPHRSDEVPVYQLPGFPQFADSTLEEAEELLGLEFVDAEWEHGAIGMVWVERSIDDKHGAAQWSDCGPVMWSIDNGTVMAHELGHALGLLHDLEDPDNLMWPHGGGTELTEDQIDEIRWKAWHLLNEC